MSAIITSGHHKCHFQPIWQRPKVLCHAKVQQHIHSARPDISQLKPQLQQQWDAAANSDLGDIVITPQSNKVVQWTCQECPDGHAHKWQAKVQNRSNGNGCPYCAGKMVCQHNSLATRAPHIAAELDLKANGLTPDDYTNHSNAKVAWKCSTCQHAWTAPISRRTIQGSGCPMCARERSKKHQQQPSLAASGPAVMAFWDYETNELAGLDPERITMGSGKVVHWMCSKCPLGLKHSWTGPAARQCNTRIPGLQGCPCCAGHKACRCNCLQTLYPEVAAEWDFTKNMTTPVDHTASSRFVAWWLNSKRGSWQQSISVRTRNALQLSKYSPIVV